MSKTCFWFGREHNAKYISAVANRSLKSKRNMLGIKAKTA